MAILVHGASAAETGVSDREIRIGQSIDLSGPVSEFGQDVANGTGAYFDLAIEKGGIHGCQIKLTSLDDKYKVADASARTSASLPGNSETLGGPAQGAVD